MRLCNRVALVTGSSRGIGRAIALELAACGISVIINYRQPGSAAAAVVREIEKTGGTALAVPADVSLPADRERLMNIVEREFGRLDILVNNAAVYRRQGLW
jgi:3-oxoacyl-[acyl-carrier protein] reductase